MQFLTLCADVAQEDVDGEIIAIHFATGAYYSLRDTAAEIWRLAIGGAPRDAIEQACVTAGGEAARAGVQAFFKDVAECGLLEPGMPAGAEPAGTPGEIRLSQPFATPVLEKFEDMAEFIKLDPIHDVTSAGWPFANP